LYSEDFKAHSRKNYFTGDIARRQVDAVRLSTELDIDLDELSLFSVTPYFRQNQMDLMPYWMLSFDPQFSSTTFQSYGLLTKYRHHFNEAGVIFITGLDIDVTPSSYKEEQLNMVLDKNIYVDYSRTGRRNYDFNATQNSVSPYVHAEWALSEVLIASFGLRYDWFNVVYQDDLDNSIPEVIGWQKWYRPDNQRIDYDQWSPKLGLVYHLTPNLNIYSNFRHAFRVPTAGQLFRSGSSLNTDKLSPVKADSFEVGLRGNVDMPLRYELALYHMIISDDVVNYLEGNDRKVTNAGETQHDGVEMLLAGDITGEFGFNVALSYTQQKYNDFSYVCYPPSCNQATTLNWKGNKLMQAPDILANVVLEYQPEQLAALHFELEMEHIGSYFLDQTNADKYEGYRVYHLRSRYDLNDHWQIYGRLNNLTNHYYSTSTGIVDPVNGVEYRPGMPLSFFMGFSFKW
jgi:outer membrane receptor protein involved in Fe transport